MFSKTFFSRLKHANDVTIMTGAGVSADIAYPQTSIDMRNTAGIDRSAFDADASIASTLSAWAPSAKPALGHYSFLDIDKKLSNLHLMTTTADGLHTKAGLENVMELNGTFADPSTLRFKGEAVASGALNRANEVSAVCEVFILVGVELLDDKIESLPYMAKGNGCYMAEISAGETDMTRHCNETLHGDVNDWLVKLSMIINKVF